MINPPITTGNVDILSVNTQKVSINGIEYFKNFLSIVRGDLITIYNAYDSRNVIVENIPFSDISVNGAYSLDAAQLQTTLLPVLYTRDTLGNTVTGVVESVTGALVDNTDPQNPIINTPTKAQVGLGNVDNTSDANKPISSATQTALNGKEDVANKSVSIPTDGTSNTKYPSAKAVKDYVDSANASFVPYTGATQGVDLGTNFLKADYLELSTSTTEPIDIGKIVWDSQDGTFNMGLLNHVNLNVGQDMFFYAKSAENIAKGTPVMFVGVQGDHLLVANADRQLLNSFPNYFMGIANQDITQGDFGYITAFGKVTDIDTTTYNQGAVLYFDSDTSTPGKLTEVMPSASNAKIEVAAVVRVHQNQGMLMVRPHVMPMLNELQDINVNASKTTPINADSVLLQDTEDQNIWKKLSWSNIKATLKTYFDTLYQKGTGTTNYISKFTGASTLGNSQIFDNGQVNIGSTSFAGDELLMVSMNGTTNTQAINVKDRNASGNGSTFMVFRKSDDTFLGNIRRSGTSDALFVGGNSFLALGTGGNTESMRITSGGNVGIDTTTPTERLDVAGNIKSSGFVRVGNSVDTASINNVGAIRYRDDANNSYVDMVMKTGVSTYEWVNIVQNNF